MATYISETVQKALDQARLQQLKKKNRLRVQMGEEVYPILRKWDGGFSVEGSIAPQLRGLVDIFDGSRHLSQCLIVASEAEAGEMCYEYKRATAAVEQAPVDFYKEPTAPVGLLGSDGVGTAKGLFARSAR